LARFSDRIDASLGGTIRAALQSRVPVVTPNEFRRVLLLKAERESRFWGTMVDVSQRRAREGQSTDAGSRVQVYQALQGIAKSLHSTRRIGVILDREREFTAESMRKVLMVHGLSPSYAPPRKTIEELSEAEFEAMLERCANNTDQQAI
jgi:hypothetical protein